MNHHGVLIFGVGCLALAGCDLSRTETPNERQVSGGAPQRGREIVASGAYGCAGCHTIRDIRVARGTVGPPLDGMARRSFIAGQLPNEPEVMLAFLQDPASLVPQTGMPNALLSLQQARDIAAYLYTLEPANAR